MKYKYILISGLASNEEEDMLKLSNYAKEGWILESISLGLFYKLKKSEPQDIIYSLDYQSNVTDDYYLIFENSGWKHLTSIGEEMHIFSASNKNLPIYSDSETELIKYTKMKVKTKKGLLFSLIINILLILPLIPSIFISKLLFNFILILLMLDIVVLIFNLIPYLSYRNKIKQISSNGKYEKDNFTKARKLYVFAIILYLIAISITVITKEELSISLVMLTLITIYLGFSNFKKSKKYNG